MLSLKFQDNHNTGADILVSMTTKRMELLIGQKMLHPYENIFYIWQ